MTATDEPAAASASVPVAAEPLRLLFEERGLPASALPELLATTYGGDLGFKRPCLYGNFVESLDGVVALGPEHPSSGSAISGREPADRFVMGLLRAFADAVLIGAGTLRATPEHRWTPDHVYPAASSAFADLRRTLGRTAAPELVVVTARGDVPSEHPALREGALVLTTHSGAERLSGRLPASCTVVAIGEGPELPMADVVAFLSVRGHTLVLTEGGPLLFAQLVGEGLLDELFLTISPVFAGRDGTDRPGLVAGLELLPEHPEWADLVSVRRRGAYLFLRYRTRRGTAHGGHDGRSATEV